MLLFHLTEPGEPAYWYLPGGGLEPGEDAHAAVVRELREEAGIEDVTLGPIVVRVTGVRFSFRGRRYEQDETHVIGRLDGGMVGEGLDDMERAAVAGHRWWSSEELMETSERVYPTGLGRIVADLIRSGPPSTPLVIAADVTAPT